ncbi:thiol:disulfide interchange protein DsbA/DsbL [Hydrogenophaga sp.]|uniref:thiol:disulfide interchange protein DsbA/DsbL n=1 Tax=Hydrogenophaga sp. TaxID=1904254 RepID=UPI00199C8C1F|nr:thiol:disulfide interchange protein DsbA/DsbL [Hydrogenophaga sp.]MBD3893735.1 thiol:disulfide interchange protein DsbA/DsbL [Hydrogenophaga sp.]
MQRREFSRAALLSGAAASVGLAGLLSQRPAHAQTAAPREGRDFLRLARPAPVDSPPGKIEVLEFFAYTCVHCFNFEPLLSAWMRTQAADVVVRRTPVAFSDAFVPYQRLYYALEAMSQIDALHARVFRAIHVDRQRLGTPEAITDWVVRQGVDREKFSGFYNSFAVAGRVRRATQLQEAYLVEGTPSLGVAGRFYVPGQGARTLQVAQALIAGLRSA